MGGTDIGAYGRAFADVYDDWYRDITDVDATVAALAALVDGGRALELGVGTGRIAIPLSELCEVHGIDSSPEMLARLAAKPGAERVRTIVGDMADPPGKTRYDLVFATFNTFFNLADDESQQRCLVNVAGRMSPKGALVIEAVVPADPGDLRPRHDDSRRSDGAGGTIRTLTTHEPGPQVVHGVHVHARADGSSVDRVWRIHYQRPAQLDPMCARAGLILDERWADWTGRPFGGNEERHVSVYRLEPG